ncbi:MAG: hypothetical protein IPF71_08110 [Rhodoferax sp.]|nr:hypothetical protein [Rhodoferax sp.]
MFWTVLAVAAIAAAFFQLGATTVWVSVLSLALKAVFGIVAISAVGFLLWRRSKWH